MVLSAKRAFSVFFFLATVGLVALLSESLQRGSQLCTLDGTVIRPLTRVTIRQQHSEIHFCSLCCARTWLDAHADLLDAAREGRIRITVVDEISGEPMDATLAYWVESVSFSRRENNCRLHVFKDPGEAARHIRRYDGRERPGWLAGLGKNLPWAATFRARDLSGRNIGLRDYRGRVIFLRFWNSGNPFAAQDLAYLAEAHNRWQEHGFTVIAVNIEQEEAAVKEFIAPLGLPFPVLLDREGKVADRYGVKGFPTGFLIDRAGIIRNRSIGEILPDLMQPLIEPLL